MVDLFRMELDEHSGKLLELLPELHELSPASLDQLVRAAHSIKGAARVVALNQAVGLAAAMEELFDAFRKGTQTPDKVHLEILQDGVRLYRQLAASDDIPEMLDVSQSEFTALAEKLSGFLTKVSPATDASENPKAPEKQGKPLPPTTLDIDPEMLALFRSELETHTEAIETGLIKVAKEPTPELLEALMRAAHSIKGAARIVGLHQLVGLAHTIENVLIAGQRSEVVFYPKLIDALLAGNDVFKNLGETSDADIPLYLQSVETQVAEFISSIEILVKSAPEEKVSSEKTRSDVKPETEKAPSSVQPEIVVDIPEIDPAMADLFKAELETHTQVLETGLLNVEKNQTPENIEPLMRAAHSMKGAARMVGVSPCVGLAHSMEDLLVSAQKGNVTLTSGQIDILLQSTDIFSVLSKTDVKDFGKYFGKEAGTIDRLIGALKGVSDSESPDQKSAVKSAEEPKTKKQVAPSASKASGKPVRDDDVIKIQAEKLTRLIGLSGECLIQAKSAQNFQGLLKHIKDLYLGMESRLTKIHGILIAENASMALNEEIQELNDNLAQTSEFFSTHMDKVKFLSWKLETLADHLYGEVLNIRMQPFSEGMYGFSRMVRDLAKDLDKKVDFEIGGSNSMVDSNILKKLEAPLNHLVRNAVDHAIESPEDRVKSGKSATGKILVEARHRSGMLEVLIQDDGKGIDFAGLKRKIAERGYATADMVEKMSRDELADFLFLPGFSTKGQVTTISGRGVGLDIVNSMAQEVGGQVSVTSELGQGTTFLLRLPLTMSVLRVLLVEIAGEPYGLQLSRIDSLFEVSSKEIAVIEDRQYVTMKGEQIGLLSAHQVLQLPQQPLPSDRVGVIVISDRMNQYGLVVDRFLGSREVVVLPLDPRLGKIPNIRAGAVLDDGNPILIMDGNDLVRSIDNLLNRARLRKVTAALKSGVEVKKRILVVDDSLTVREVERRLLENRGYDVTVAVDGMDGWNTLQTQIFDLIISDVDMPRMTGFELVGRIKRHPGLKAIPVMIVSYKDREEDRMRGLAAGANYYFTKSSFHDETLLAAVRDLIGDP